LMWSEPFFAPGPITLEAAALVQPMLRSSTLFLPRCLVLPRERPRRSEACSEDAVGTRRLRSG
jgi:hypothetical protein